MASRTFTVARPSQLDMPPGAPTSTYGAYPSSYDDTVFPTNGMGNMVSPAWSAGTGYATDDEGFDADAVAPTQGKGETLYTADYHMGALGALGLGGFGFGLGGLPDGWTGDATVTTSDPAPAGDLKVHSGPSASSPQIGGADKGSTVVVVEEPGLPAGWGKVGTIASERNPQVVGYASLAYLTAVPGTGRVIAPNDPGVLPTLPGLPSVPEVSGMSLTKKILLGAAGLAAAAGIYYAVK